MSEPGKPVSGLRFFGKYPAFVRYFAATVITRFGDSLDAIAYMWLVLDLTRSTLAMGTVMVINSLPNIILGPFAGVIADRSNRKRLIIACDAFRGLLVSIIALLAYAGYLQLWMLYITTLLGSVAETIQAPARMAITPSLIVKDDLLTGNAMNSLSESVAQFMGLGAAGAIIAVLGTPGAIAIDALTFWASAVLIATLPLAGDKRAERRLNIKGFMGDFAEGLRFVGRTKVVLLCIILACLTNFFLGPVNVLMPAFMKMELRLSAGSLSLVYLAMTIGMLVGSLLVPPVARKLGAIKSIRLGFIILSCGYGMLLFAGNAISVAVCLGGLGLGVPLASAGLRTVFQQQTPLEKMGRTSAVMNTLVLAAMPLSTGSAGALGQMIRPQHLFGALGLLIFISTMLLTFNPAFANPVSGMSETESIGL